VRAPVPDRDAARSLSFDEALAFAPTAPGAAAPRRALEARRAGDEEIGGAAQALTLTLNPGYRMQPDAERGLEGQVGVAQSWNVSGVAGKRRRAAAAERAALSAEARAAALGSRLGAARLWIELHTLERLEELAQRQLSLARQSEELLERAVDAGVRTSIDLAQARAFRSEVALRLLEVHGAAAQTALDLGVVLGQRERASLRTRGPLPRPTLPGPEELDRYVERASALPRQAALRLSATAARARQAEERAGAGTVLSTGVQLQREPPNAYTALGTFSLALQPAGGSARQRSREAGDAAQLEGEAAQAVVLATAEVRGALHELRHAQERRELVASVTLPAARELVTRLQRAYEAGETTAYELVDARRRAVELEQVFVRAEGDHAWAAVRLWLLAAEIERATEQ
jgi:cobalt-zinc-cadmium efflux system outer membrane protein